MEKLKTIQLQINSILMNNLIHEYFISIKKKVNK